MSDCAEMPVDTLEDRIAKALKYAVAYGGIDGSHHKDWTIDQMVRALTGCPIIEEAQDNYSYKTQGESEEYKNLVSDACNGEDGPETYTWDIGIPP